jgi:hypothetical protein
MLNATRAATCLVMLFASLLAGVAAQACQLIPNAPPAPGVFWSKLPTVLQPGESVVEVSFLRVGQNTPPGSNYIVIGCGPPSQVYRVERIISGEQVGPVLALRSDSDFTGAAPLYVVGKLSDRTREEFGPVDYRHYWPDYDPEVRLFEARSPPR